LVEVFQIEFQQNLGNSLWEPWNCPLMALCKVWDFVSRQHVRKYK
jgi:hypothetical protein